MKYTFLFIGLSLSMALSACSSTTSSPVVPASSPGPGSTYTYSRTHTDAAGTKPSETVTDTLISTSLPYRGMTNVAYFHSNKNDTSYYHFDDNGDIQNYLTLTVPFIGSRLTSVWQRVPFASHNPVFATLADTTLQTYNVQLKIYDTATYIGTDTLVLNGQSLAMQKAAVNGTGTATGQILGATYYEYERDTFWYAPSIRYIAKSIRHTGSTPAATDSTNTQVLTSYTIK